MNKPLDPITRASVCPHDCPSTCALEVDVLGPDRIGRIRGAADNPYTDGVICAKVARYAERVHHPDRLLKPMRRIGTKGDGRFEPISWNAALDEVAEAFLKAEQKLGAQSVWPYHYAGTMGQVQRDSIHRLRHVKGYSRQFDTICTNPAWTGYIAGTGALRGSDPREMAVSDCIVIWGTNAVATQVNVMTHAVKARKQRGTKIVAVDVYRNETIRQADIGLVLRPGTDGALACAVMHVLFRDGHADRAYLDEYTDCPAELEAHLATRTPEWASAITGLSVEEIEAFAKLVGETPATYFRLGYGFTRARNGTTAMHAVASIPAVTGAWRHKGGGAFHSNSGIYDFDKSMIEGTDVLDPTTRRLDQSRIGAVLTGEPDALLGGPDVAAMLIQNTNPASVCPDQEKVRAGFGREDLFVCVHEQFMTETALMADIVLPATTFLEHDDVYKGGGHQYILLGPKLVEAPGEARENLFVPNELMKRLGVDHPGNAMTAREHIDWMLKASGYGDLETLERDRWLDIQPPFEDAHFLNGFGHADGKYHFKPDWLKTPANNDGGMGPYATMPDLPDHWSVLEEADEDHPFRLVTAPARSFLNSSFTETPSSRKKEGRPEVMVHPQDAARLGLADGDLVSMGNHRGEVRLHLRIFEGVQRGVVISEGIWANRTFVDGKGINTLTGADPVAPYGGAALHDNKVWLREG
ncbi:molybdopterin oxidoreductase family protein [Breoghania sp.]|uniref:molybdopterin-containing oxidoreductase family protein n=1 Tax=Breoghania sp. TaxID=2065378 RepID=UPI0029CA1BA7|nr:molybdopterin oxidoreductase family protein [Breoghania sp.]